MTVPQIQRVHLVLNHHVEIFNPFGLVVEPREVLWCIGILIDRMTWQVHRLLQTDTRATHHHTRSLLRGLNV